MSQLSEIVKVIKERKILAESKVDERDLNVFNAKLGQVRRAKEDLEELYLEYRKLVHNNCLFILTTGGQADKFAEISKESFNCFTVDVDNFYNTLIKDVNQRYYDNQTSGSALFDLIGSMFEEIAKDIGIISYPALIFEQKYRKILKNKEDLLDLVKRAFNDKVGAEVVGYYAIDIAAREAVNQLFDGKIVPIVLTVSDQTILKELSIQFKKITQNIFIISTGSKVPKEIKDNSINSIRSVTDKSVEETLVKIKEHIL